MTEPQTRASTPGRAKRRLLIAAVVTVLCLLPFALAALGVPLPLPSAAVSSELKPWPADDASRSELKPWPIADSELKPWPAAEAELKQFPAAKAAVPAAAPAKPATH